MCLRVVEKYAVCGCIFHVHGVDACSDYDEHDVVETVTRVGEACPMHRDDSELIHRMAQT